jgi:HSP20 family protein
MTNDTLSRTRREAGEVSPFSRMVDEWFGLTRWPGAFGAAEMDRLLKPALDVAETEHAYVVHAELPGVAKDDVTITIEDGTLVLTGEKKREEKHEASGREMGWHRIERTYGSFQRTLALPKGVDADRAEAAFQDGVLTITIPKSEQAKPKTLKVK